ncbi:hypothetical protein [Brumicola blandensis]|uniref:Uncharacterized protein n=1 Tax=Brumicola blandensis TaxID=3075611 RepID=A0AAW8QW99_9ALTE|nr:hypothetical protein [Alteromonas sp. W409]MDT0581433.1 hypothetical protein [Alteromonas sp. W409]
MNEDDLEKEIERLDKQISKAEAMIDYQRKHKANMRVSPEQIFVKTAREKIRQLDSQLNDLRRKR